MNTLERTGSSPASSILTPPDSAKELSTSPPSIHTSLSQPAQYAFQIIKSAKHGRRPDSPWIKLRLEPGDFCLLEERLKVEDIWGYVEDKIRFDYDSQTRLLIFRMPTSTHEIFTEQVADEIKDQLRRLCMNISSPNIATLARSIQCGGSSDIFMLGESDQSRHSPDKSFLQISMKFPSLIIETSYSQKRKDLSRLADDYVFGSDGNIKMMIGLDIEYRNTRRATVSVWKSKQGIKEDRVPYLRVEKIIDNEPFRNDNSSPVLSDGNLFIPLHIFAVSGDAPLPDVAISIPYTTLWTFLNNAELFQQQTKKDGSGFMEQLPPRTLRERRERTPEEQLEEEDEAKFVASEEKAEGKADKEDSTWGH